MEPTEQSLLQEKFRSHLAQERDFMSGSMKNTGRFHYKGIPDFLLCEEQFFELRPLPAGIEYMEPNHCIKNTYWTALRERFIALICVVNLNSHEPLRKSVQAVTN